ncbi:MAG: hypothetical protein ACKVP5_15910 [Aestuariivirga sp.]
MKVSDTQEMLNYLHLKLVDSESSRRNLNYMRKNIKSLRDAWIAHSLEDAPASQVTVFHLRDCIVFCGNIIKISKLVLLGVNWNPKYHWRTSLRCSQFFVDRYEKGFVFQIPSTNPTE